MPLVGSIFDPGSARDVVKEIEKVDKGLAEIAKAEVHMFTSQAEECVAIAEKYCTHEDLILRLSANIICTFGNMPLGNIDAIRQARADVCHCMHQVAEKGADVEVMANCLFAFYAISIFIHIPPEEELMEEVEIPPLEEYIRHLPVGQRLFAVGLLAHQSYMNGEYTKALGRVQTALILTDDVYPIAMVYLRCIAAMCQINLKDQAGAAETIAVAWEMARKDKFLEPFVEYHGLLLGLIEAHVRKTEPDIYKKLVKKIIAFSRGWMKIHNPKMQGNVTDLLSPMEFSVAMMACRDWSNQEIAEHLCISVNTVKHYVSDIMQKLHVTRRNQLKQFVNL